MKRIIRLAVRKFEKKYNYDASYLHDINDHSARASAGALLLNGLSDYVGPNAEIWAGAALHSTRSTDCGPCIQLAIDRALEHEVCPIRLEAVLAGNWEKAATVGTGYLFSVALHSNDKELSHMRTQIVNKFGTQALIAASYASLSFQIYPKLKQALGYDTTCQTLMIGQKTLSHKF